jgi:hypothetical protein
MRHVDREDEFSLIAKNNPIFFLQAPLEGTTSYNPKTTPGSVFSAPSALDGPGIWQAPDWVAHLEP